jgi:hypothetical protein
MDQAEREAIKAEVAYIDEHLAADAVTTVLTRVQGLHSMARLTAFNLAAVDEHVSSLSDESFARSLLADLQSPSYLAFVERFTHLAHNYLLSAIPLLEHTAIHVRTHYPAGSQAHTQYERGLDMALDHSEVHKVVRQLRHHVAHRGLPPVTLVAQVHDGQFATPVISRRILLDDDKCGGAARRILEGLPMDIMALDGLLLDHGLMVLQFAEWFFGVQALHSLDDIMPIARLQQRREALLAELAAEADQPQ